MKYSTIDICFHRVHHAHLDTQHLLQGSTEEVTLSVWHVDRLCSEPLQLTLRYLKYCAVVFPYTGTASDGKKINPCSINSSKLTFSMQPVHTDSGKESINAVLDVILKDTDYNCRISTACRTIPCN